MCINLTIFLIISVITCANSSLLLWSSKKIHLSPLKHFNNNNLLNLLEKLQNPELSVYKLEQVTPDLKEIIKNHSSVFLPNGELNEENITDLSGNADSLSVLREKTSNPNFLITIILPSKRAKRQIESTTTSSTTVQPFQPPKGPVLYRGISKKDDLYAIFYSSKPLLLKINNTVRYLGNTSPDLITVDTVARDSYTRLNVNVPLEDGGKITLRFLFSWLKGYWSLAAIKITESNNNLSFNLTTEQQITASARFSYHCGGVTTFSDVSNVEFQLYDLQVQIDSKNGKFGDPYDCVPFTTAPIWSGVFVTTLLGLGLIIALMAIGDIKAMDKFDNHKTKQLTITVNE